MTYAVFPTALTNKLDSWYPKANGFNANVTVRLGHLASLPVRYFATVLDSAIGRVGVAVTLLTLCLNKDVYVFTKRQLKAEQLFLSNTFKAVVNVFNPAALSGICIKGAGDKRTLGYKRAVDDGFLAEGVKQFFKEVAKTWRNNHDNFFLRHVASRITFAFGAVAIAASRIIDLVIGVVAAVGALFANIFVCPFASDDTRHSIDDLTEIAYLALQVGGVFRDLYKGAAKTVNPWINE